MIRIQAIIDGKEWDITSIVQKVTWSGSLSQCMRTLNISYKIGDDMPITYFPSGAIIIFEVRKTLFKGRLFKPSRNLKTGSGTMVAYDDSVFMSKSNTSLKYCDATVNEVMTDICKRYGLNYTPNQHLSSMQSDTVFNKSGNSIIKKILAEEKVQTGKTYFTRTFDDTVSILEEGEEMAKYLLKPSENLTELVLSEDALSVVNDIEIVNKNGAVVRHITDEALVKQLGGRLTKALKETENWQEKSKTMLKPIKYSYSFKGLTEIADVSFIAGNKVKLEDALKNAYFIIESDSHTFDGTKHTMDLKVKMVEEEM